MGPPHKRTGPVVSHYQPSSDVNPGTEVIDTGTVALATDEVRPPRWSGCPRGCPPGRHECGVGEPIPREQPPQPPAPPTQYAKPAWWRRTWVVATTTGLLGLGLGTAIGSAGAGSEDTSPTTARPAAATRTTPPPVSAEPSAVEPSATETKADLNSSQQNAVDSAESYLEYTAFSRSGLIEQLEYEGFSKKDATFAVDHIDPDWNEQAVHSAKSYLETGSFSRSGLIEQLEYEGFTHDQAVYGTNKAYR